MLCEHCSGSGVCPYVRHGPDHPDERDKLPDCQFCEGETACKPCKGTGNIGFEARDA